MKISSYPKFLLAILALTALGLCYLCLQNINIGFLQLHSIDEYIFHWSIRHMIESFLTGNLSGIFGFGFYQYGFIYFLLNAIAAAPGILTDNYAWAITAPRILTSLFAIGSLIYIYKFSRLYVSEISATLITTIFVTMPAFWYNATWFHPDWPMTFFLLVFVYYLAKDNWEFGKYFKYAVVAYSLALAFKYQALTALPIIGLYIFYEPLKKFNLNNLQIAGKRFVFAVGSSIFIFILCNPYILHPMGWNAFQSAFSANMLSNSNNNGSALSVSMVDKVNLAIGDFYLNIIFIFIFILGSIWLSWLYFKIREKSIFSVIAINFLINIVYLLLFVNKAWQTYYLPVFMVGLLSLIYFLRKISSSQQKLLLSFICITQIIIYSSSYLPILNTSRDAKAPDFITYNEVEKATLDKFLITNLSNHVDSETRILLTPYTPFSFDLLNLRYDQVNIIFGALDKSSFDIEFYLQGQKKYWGDLKTEEELRASYIETDIIILRKDIPFIAPYDLSVFDDRGAYEASRKIVRELYSGKLGYHVLAENNLVVIFSKK